MFRKHQLRDRSCHRISPVFTLSLLTVWKPASISNPCYQSDTQRLARDARGVCVMVQTHNRLKAPWKASSEEWKIPSLPYWRYQIQLFRSTLLPVTWSTICLPYLTQWSLFITVQIHLVLLPEAGWQHTRPLSDLRGRNGTMVPKCRLKGSIDPNQRCKEFEGAQKMCVKTKWWPLPRPPFSSDVSHPLMFLPAQAVWRDPTCCVPWVLVGAESGGLGQLSATPLSTPESTPCSLPGLCFQIRIAPQISQLSPLGENQG